jgi:methyl-accepting chemotaxis protein
MSKEVTNKKILQELRSFKTNVSVDMKEMRNDMKEMNGKMIRMNGDVKKINGEIKEMNGEIKGVKNCIKNTENNLTDLTIITKMGFDEMGMKVDQNTHSITELNHRVTENSDRLTRVEINMNQEFAAATRQRRRLLDGIDNHNERLCILEA